MSSNNYRINNQSIKLIISFATLIVCFGCSNQKHKNLSDVSQKTNITESLDIDTSLIAKLATMQTDTLDCSADIYWQIIGKGKSYIPALIKSLTDTTTTNIYHGCKVGKLNIGELSYFALEKIGDFPAFIVTQIRFDTILLKEGWGCWSFYDYFFDNKNKKEYQDKVRSFYEKSQFKFVKYPDSLITTCMRDYKIMGWYRWKE